jgi:hypothetical protein
MDNDEKNAWQRERQFDYFKHITTLFTAIAMLYATLVGGKLFVSAKSMTSHLMVFGFAAFGIFECLQAMTTLGSMEADKKDLPLYRVQFLFLFVVLCAGLGLIELRGHECPTPADPANTVEPSVVNKP